MTTRQLQSLARENGTPIVVIDHDILRQNYLAFKKRHSKWTQGNMEFIKKYTVRILRSRRPPIWRMPRSMHA